MLSLQISLNNIDYSRRRGELIRSIIYMHPITNDGLNPANVEFNVKMLQEIAKDAMGNVIIVTTKWDRIPDSNRDSMEAGLRKGLMQFYQDPFMRHDNSKWSALGILNNAKKKTPILLDLKEENPSITSAGEVLTDRIDKLIEFKQKEEADLRRKIITARKERNQSKEGQLKEALKRVVDTLLRLRDDTEELGSQIDWEQAARDNVALEGVIKERHDSATKDWKAEYDKLANDIDIESKAKVVRLLCSVNFSLYLTERIGRRSVRKYGMQKWCVCFVHGFQVSYLTERIGRRNVMNY